MSPLPSRKINTTVAPKTRSEKSLFLSPIERSSLFPTPPTSALLCGQLISLIREVVASGFFYNWAAVSDFFYNRSLPQPQTHTVQKLTLQMTITQIYRATILLSYFGWKVQRKRVRNGASSTKIENLMGNMPISLMLSDEKDAKQLSQFSEDKVSTEYMRW